MNVKWIENVVVLQVHWEGIPKKKVFVWSESILTRIKRFDKSQRINPAYQKCSGKILFIWRIGTIGAITDVPVIEKNQSLLIDLA